jgi:hypothetical protein
MCLGEFFLGEAIVMRVTKSIVLGIAATFILATGIITAAAANGTQGAHGAAVSAVAKTQGAKISALAKTHPGGAAVSAQAKLHGAAVRLVARKP